MWNEKLKRLRKNEKKQTITISIAAGNYDAEIIIDLIDQTTSGSSIKSQVLDLKTLPIFSPLKSKYNCFAAFLQIALIWLLKERRLSIFSPKRSTWVSLSIRFSFILIGILSVRLQFFECIDGLAIVLF